MVQRRLGLVGLFIAVWNLVQMSPSQNCHFLQKKENYISFHIRAFFLKSDKSDIFHVQDVSKILLQCGKIRYFIYTGCFKSIFTTWQNQIFFIYRMFQKHLYNMVKSDILYIQDVSKVFLQHGKIRYFSYTGCFKSIFTTW